MDRVWVQNKFEEMGSRVTIRKGNGMFIRGFNAVLAVNVVSDRKGEHFTMTIHPQADEALIDIQVLDTDAKLRQMLLMIKYPYEIRNGQYVLSNAYTKERLLVGHDEMHWFVAGVTQSNNIKEAFANLRPSAVTLAMHKTGVKDKDWRRRKTKGFIRQGEWFFVPVHFEEDKTTVILKNEPIQRRGSSRHMCEELVRFGGKAVYANNAGDIISPAAYKGMSPSRRMEYTFRRVGAKVFARGRITHKDHQTIVLKGWHEVFLSNERGTSSNAFID